MMLAAVQITLLFMDYINIIEYTVPFQEFMRWLGEWFSNFFEPIEEWVRVALATIAIPLPDLFPHWHQVFVLHWLLLSSLAGAYVRDLPVDAPLLGVVWMRSALITIAILFWALVCSFSSSVMSGTQPPNSIQLMSWPITGLAVFTSGMFAWRGAYSQMALYLICGVLFAVFGYFVPQEVSFFGFEVVSPGLLFWFMLVGITGVYAVVVGLFSTASLRQWLTDPVTISGIDVVGAYSFAMTFAALFGSAPS